MKAESPNDRLKLARERAGYSSASRFAATHGITGTTYRSHENGDRTVTLSVAKRYAPLLGVTWQWLLEGDEMSANGNIKDSERHKSTILTKLPHLALSRDKLEVLGMAECGPDGFALWNGEVVDLIDRPPQFANAPKAYAVFVVGESMEPAFHPSNIAYVNPDKPVGPGCYVLVQIQPPEGESTPRAFLKRLVRRSGNKVILEQFEPKKTFTLAQNEILSMHRVIGSLEP